MFVQLILTCDPWFRKYGKTNVDVTHERENCNVVLNTISNKITKLIFLFCKFENATLKYLFFSLAVKLVF